MNSIWIAVDNEGKVWGFFENKQSAHEAVRKAIRGEEVIECDNEEILGLKYIGPTNSLDLCVMKHDVGLFEPTGWVLTSEEDE